MDISPFIMIEEVCADFYDKEQVNIDRKYFDYTASFGFAIDAARNIAKCIDGCVWYSIDGLIIMTGGRLKSSMHKVIH